jgi:hypothetical protein
LTHFPCLLPVYLDLSCFGITIKGYVACQDFPTWVYRVGCIGPPPHVVAYGLGEG